MVITVIGHKLKSFVLFLVSIFRRALCCIQRRRRISFDEPLTDVGVVKSENDETLAWNDWGDVRVNRKPTTVQEHIEFYRQQKAHLQKQEQIVEEQMDLFEDMTPAITKQKKIFINKEGKQGVGENLKTLIPDTVYVGNELGEWDENPGWEGEQLDWDATEALKEKKRQDRERRMAEQQQKRIERANKPLGIKISS